MTSVALVMFFFYGGKLSTLNLAYRDVDACRQAAVGVMRTAGPLHLAGIRYVCLDQATGKALASGGPETPS